MCFPYCYFTWMFDLHCAKMMDEPSLTLEGRLHINLLECGVCDGMKVNHGPICNLESKKSSLTYIEEETAGTLSSSDFIIDT